MCSGACYPEYISKFERLQSESKVVLLFHKLAVAPPALFIGKAHEVDAGRKAAYIWLVFAAF